MNLSRLPQLESQLLAMTRRHDAACLIIGEKEEELEDLRQDVQSVKSMFQGQIDTLCTTVAELKKKQAPAA